MAAVPDDYGAAKMLKATGRLRETARSIALDVLSGRDQVTGLFESSTTRPRVHFLYFHSVPSPELPQFSALLDVLQRKHTFISHSVAAKKVAGGDIDRPYLSISFDDGFASNVAAARILSERAISACFFIPTNFIGIHDVVEARRFFRTSRGIDESAMTWGEIESLLSQGHEIGNHTEKHRNLSELSVAELEQEIGGASETLLRRLGERPTHFAWPYGTFEHAGPDVPRITLQTGHSTCASAERGAHMVSTRAGEQIPCLRRDHIMSSWPLRHSLYFIARSARTATPATNEFPPGWLVSE